MSKARASASKTRKPQRSYHHKDLRRALMDAALAYLEDNEITRLNMQVLARTAGVSAGAPYHHFPDKEALIAALATEGFELLNARMAQRDWQQLPAAQAMEELTHGYLDFAKEQRTHYRLMFLPEWSDRSRFEALHRAGGEALTRLAQIIQNGIEGTRAASAPNRALSVFALLHGIAELTDAKVVSSIPGAPSQATLRAQWVESVRVLAHTELPAKAVTRAKPKRS